MNDEASVEIALELPKRATPSEVELSSEPTSPRRQLTDQHRENLSRAMKKWWAKRKSAMGD